MDNILKFLLEANKLKNVQRKGVAFYGVKKPDSALDHSFRMALMVILVGRERNINITKAIKMALIHDICKIYSGDITPYDGLLPKGKKTKDKFVRRWRRLSLGEKEKMHCRKFEKECLGLKKLTVKLPPALKGEITQLWLDYNQGKTREARFVHQVNVIENLLEALESWRQNKNFPTMPWWEHVDEVVDDPTLLKLVKAIEKTEKAEIKASSRRR